MKTIKFSLIVWLSLTMLACNNTQNPIANESGKTIQDQIKKVETTDRITLSTSDKLDQNTPENFKITSEAQEAVFRTYANWTGGMGKYPILEKNKDVGSGIYLEEEKIKPLMEKNTPSCILGSPFLKISANITLQEKTAKNTSIPTNPTQSYYLAKVNEIHDIFFSFEKCQD